MIDWDSFKQQLQTNPNRTLGFVLGLAACLMLIWLVVVVQSSDPGTNRPVELAQDGRLAGLRSSLQKPDSVAAGVAADTVSADTIAGGTGEVAASGEFGKTAPPEAAVARNVPDSTRAASADSSSGELGIAGTGDRSARMGQLKSILPTLLIMVALIGGLWYWVRRKTTTPSSRSLADREFFTLLGSGELYPGQQLALIEISCEYWVVGCGPQGPKVLHRFAPEEWDGPLPDSKGNGLGDWKSYLASALKSNSGGNGLIERNGQSGENGLSNGNGRKGENDRNGDGQTADTSALNGNGFHRDEDPANGEARKLW